MWWLKSTNHVKLIEECVMCTDKHVLAKKLFIKELNMNLPQESKVEKRVYGSGNTLSSKEKVPGSSVSKEGRADSLWEHKKIHYNRFTLKKKKKGANVNSASDCQLIEQNLPY